MKLSDIYNHYTLRKLTIVLLIGIFSHYIVIRFFIHRSADYTLKEFQYNIEQYVAQHDTLIVTDNPLLSGSSIAIKPLRDNQYEPDYFRDTLVYSQFREEYVVFRLLTYSKMINDNNYSITLSKATMDTEEMMYAIILSLLVLYLLFAFFSVWWSRWFNKRLWSPFYQTLDQLQRVDFVDAYQIKTKESQVDEFNFLNRDLNRMLERIQLVYTDMREFSETASHELQTPLTIVKTRLELLQQREHMSPEDAELISSVYRAVDRVIRIGRHMLMIAKIRNDQFPAKRPLALVHFIEEFLTSYEDMIEMKSINVVKHFEGDLVVSLHPLLAEILVSNLLSNAIRYNTSEGEIVIHTTSTSCSISNSYANRIPKGDLFVRFNRSKERSDSTGLGLAIVKSICDSNNLKVHTEVTDQRFKITVEKRY